MDTAPQTGERITLYQADRGAFEGWWHTNWSTAEAYWMDDADSEPDPVAWRPLLPGPFEYLAHGGVVEGGVQELIGERANELGTVLPARSGGVSA